MNIRFESNPYLDCVKENLTFNHNGRIFEWVNVNPQFSYSEVSYNQFKEKYTGEGWIGRKFMALPAALWSGIVKSISHLTLAIFVGIPKALAGDGRCLKANLFKIPRDFQESWGRLASLFNDSYGQYHILESQFHKTCYHSFALPIRAVEQRVRLQAESDETEDASNQEAEYANEAPKPKPVDPAKDDIKSEVKKDIPPQAKASKPQETPKKEVKLSQLTKEQINMLFPERTDSAFDRPAFAVFDAKDVQAALLAEKLSRRHVSLLSVEQIQGLDFTAFPQKVINFLFPPCSVDYFREKYSYGGVTTTSVVNGKIFQTTTKKCQLTEAELMKVSHSHKLKNDALMKHLTPKQKEYLAPRLYKESDAKPQPAQGSSSSKPQPHYTYNPNGSQPQYTYNPNGSQPQYTYNPNGSQPHYTYNPNGSKPQYTYNSGNSQTQYTYPQYTSNPNFNNFFNSFFNGNNASYQNFGTGTNANPFGAGFGTGYNPYAQFFGTGFGAGYNAGSSYGVGVQIQSTKKQNLGILGLSETATMDEIKQKYKKMALQYHPDKNPQKPGESDEDYKRRVQDKFVKIQQAYEALIQ